MFITGICGCTWKGLVMQVMLWNLGLEKHVACGSELIMLGLPMHVIPQKGYYNHACCPSIAQISSASAQSSNRILLQSYTKCRMHVIVTVIQSYTNQCPSRSLRSGAATCAWSTITQTDYLIVHVVQAQWTSGGNAFTARRSHDDRPC